MIIVLSNREIHSKHSDHRYFGEELAQESAAVSMAIFEPGFDESDDFDEDQDVGEFYFEEDREIIWKASAIKTGLEEEKLKEIANQINTDELLGKKWVFFVHGNNQSMEKNLTKCRKLSMEHDVNVIAFSWPSYTKVWSTGLVKSLVPMALKDVLTPSSAIKALGKTYYDKRREQYSIARNNAETSASALINALTLVDENFVQPAKSSNGDSFKFNFIVHSLGNYVVQNMVTQIEESQKSLPKIFSNAVFHQSDVDSNNHAQWLEHCLISERKYVTVNKYDVVLRISDVFGDNEKRLGNKIKSNQLCSSVDAYIDFTKGRGIGINHGLFLLDEITNKPAHDCFTRLLRGDAVFTSEDQIPTQFKLKTKNLFKITKDSYADLEDDEYDEDFY